MLLILNLMKGWIKSASSIAVDCLPSGICIVAIQNHQFFLGNSFLVHLDHFVIFQIPNDTMTL